MTGDLADVFGDLADKLLTRLNVVPDTLWHGQGDPVAHFLMKVMFCLFAEDIGLLPESLFTKLVDRCLFEPENFQPFCAELFEKMKRGGWYGNDRVEHFNGGLFDEAAPLALNHAELNILVRAAREQWAGVEPSIFGTLFERILDPRKRAQIGAHYTSKGDILLVVEPVVMTPLRRKWSAVQEEIAPHLQQIAGEKDRKKRDVIAAPIRVKLDDLRRHLGEQRILDPACGSGNFLYVALQQLLDLDDEIVRSAARYDIALNPLPYIRPTQLHGIEINPYAAELAQVVIWIGYLQWMAEHQIDNPKRPILDKLVMIENRDAILDLSKPKLPTPAQWPKADFIIGNPPFLGNKLFRGSGLSDAYISSLYRAYDLNKNADLCCYWFEQARRAIGTNSSTRVGLLATQGIRGRDVRQVIDRIKESGEIFSAWSDKDWVLEGANVHVSIICFDHAVEKVRYLDGKMVSSINADLSSATNLPSARRLPENKRLGFVGACKKGKFEIPCARAREMLAETGNPSGRDNSEVMAPWFNGIDIVRRYEGDWIIDFGIEEDLAAASAYEAPFEYVKLVVKPERDKVRNPAEKRRWWLLARPAPDLRSAVASLKRFIVVPQVAKHRVFGWLANDFLPSHQLSVLARDDDYFFGILQGAPHCLWSLELGTQLEDRPRYTPTTCFETFPLPWPPGKEEVKHPAYLRIAEAARRLNEQRERWLNPPEWIEPLAAKIDAADKFEDVPPEARALVRQSAIMAAAAKDARLKKRTLTNLYNERPTWLKLAHQQLDRAVLAAYAAVDPAGDWSEDWADVWIDSGAGQPLPPEHALHARRQEIDQRVLANLLRLNHGRAGVSDAPPERAKARKTSK